MDTTSPKLYRVEYTGHDDRDNVKLEKLEIIADNPIDAIFSHLGVDPENVDFIPAIEKDGYVRFSERKYYSEVPTDTDCSWRFKDSDGIDESVSGEDYYWAYWRVTGPLTKKTCSCCNGTGEVDANVQFCRGRLH